MDPIKSFKSWLFDQSPQKPATIEALVTEETIKTIQVSYKNRTVWLQKSLVMLKNNEGNKVTIIIPLWLYTRKFTGAKAVKSKKVKSLFEQFK